MAIFGRFSKILKLCVLYQDSTTICQIWGSWGQKRPFQSQKRVISVFRKYPFTQNKKLAKVHSRQTLLLLQFSIFFDGTNFFGITKTIAHITYSFVSEIFSRGLGDFTEKFKNRVFQLCGEIPESPGKNFRNERISYVRNFFVIPKKLVALKNIENCRRRQVCRECTFVIFLF